MVGNDFFFPWIEQTVLLFQTGNDALDGARKILGRDRIGIATGSEERGLVY